MNTEILHQLVHLSQTDRPFGIKGSLSYSFVSEGLANPDHTD